MMDYNDVMAAIKAEAGRASMKHPAMHSHHEAYAVIKEEFEEYWDEVKKGGATRPRDQKALKKELIHTAAMCARALYDLCHSS
jgi:hypothetical protein